MNLLAAIPLIFAQYSMAELETLCVEPETPKEIKECNYARRINLGLYSLEQLPDLIELYVLYRDNQIYDEALAVAYQIKWLVIKNDNSHSPEAVTLFTWMPDDGLENRCFIKQGWQYEDWDEYCSELRLSVADVHIVAYELALSGGYKLAARNIARFLAHIVTGILNQAPYVVEERGALISTVVNLDIPNEYRGDIWMARSR